MVRTRADSPACGREEPEWSEYLEFVARQVAPARAWAIADFGSRATGESVPDSDHDLLVLVSEGASIRLSPPLADARSGEALRRVFPEVEIVRKDVRDDINQGWTRSRTPRERYWISHPIAESRWLACALALEEDALILHHVTAGRAEFDPEGMFANLQQVLREERPFHLGPSGFVHALEGACDDRRNSLAQEMASLDAGEEPDDPEHAHIWVHGAANLLHTSIAYWTLIQRGFPLWSAPDTRSIVAREFPAFSDVVDRTLIWKATPAGRSELERSSASYRPGLMRLLELQTERLIALSRTVVEKGRALIESGETPLPPDHPGRFQRLLSRYLEIFGVSGKKAQAAKG